jgi:hypothetical protein
VVVWGWGVVGAVGGWVPGEGDSGVTGCVACSAEGQFHGVLEEVREVVLGCRKAAGPAGLEGGGGAVCCWGRATCLLAPSTPLPLGHPWHPPTP